MEYNIYENKVYNWLMEKNRKNESFTFSVRQKAMKGAELDYFIGTERSNYFGTTLWNIPVAYPGSSTDLINIIFRQNEVDKFSYNIQFVQTKKPHDAQNSYALEFIRNLKPIIKATFKNFFENEDKNKMEYYNFGSNQPYYSSLEVMLSELDKDLDTLIPIIDNEINKMKLIHPDFIAAKITSSEFNNLIKKMENRFNKYQNIKVDDIEDEIDTEFEKPNDINIPKYPINLILYGPPGTGKTYNTINKALEICGYSIKDKDRQVIKDEFERRVNEGQIVFASFHQSMCYEDFIEGIKPLEPQAGDHFLKYDIQDGIFKTIAIEARHNYESVNTAKDNKPLFEDVFEQFVEDWERNKDMKFPLKTFGYDYTIKGFSKYSIAFRKASGGESHTMSIGTLKDLFLEKRQTKPTGVGIYYPAIVEKLKSYKPRLDHEKVIKNYVLIIDEINRGNISQIFGELITLIEEDKRIGNKEALEATLTYSKNQFGVSSNLYIIGTMNTADRSVEALDTALRRRFSFEEMMPDYGLITTSKLFGRLFDKYDEAEWNDLNWKNAEEEFLQLFAGSKIGNEEDYIDKLENTPDESWYDLIDSGEVIKFNGIKLDEILRTINERIEVLLNRDHLIGHSYFIDIFSEKQLINTFYKNILPLLQEYFYGDYGKIGLILGSGFIKEKFNESKQKIQFANFKYEDADTLQKTVYEIVPSKEINIFDAIQSLLNQKTQSI